MPVGALDKWFLTEHGKALCRAEAVVLAQILPQYFGYHLLQIGGPVLNDIIKDTPIRHHTYCSDRILSGFNGDYVQSDLIELALLPESVDVVIMPHSLEFHQNPETLLAQAYLSLMPEGHLIVIGFNPLSLWGVGKLLGDHQQMPWQSYFYRCSKLTKILQQLGCDIVQQTSVLYRPPVNDSKLFQRLLFMEAVGQLLWPSCGAAYIIVARKRVATLTPMSVSFVNKSVVTPVRLTEPTPRVNKTKYD